MRLALAPAIPAAPVIDWPRGPLQPHPPDASAVASGNNESFLLGARPPSPPGMKYLGWDSCDSQVSGRHPYQYASAAAAEAACQHEGCDDGLCDPNDVMFAGWKVRRHRHDLRTCDCRLCSVPCGSCVPLGGQRKARATTLRRLDQDVPAAAGTTGQLQMPARIAAVARRRHRRAALRLRRPSPLTAS